MSNIHRIATDLDVLREHFNTTLGSMEKADALGVFMEDEMITEEARIIAADSVEMSYHGYPHHKRVSTLAIAINLEVAHKRFVRENF